jgi:hypothetical protein
MIWLPGQAGRPYTLRALFLYWASIRPHDSGPTHCKNSHEVSRGLRRLFLSRAAVSVSASTVPL